MEKTGQIEIKIKGRIGNIDLMPDNYDIRDVSELLRHVEALLYPNAKRDRPLIAYGIQEGSVRHIFKTTLQAVIGLNALLAQVKADKYSIDFLESPTARALEFFQKEAQKNDFEYEIGTSLSGSTKITMPMEG